MAICPVRPIQSTPLDSILKKQVSSASFSFKYVLAAIPLRSERYLLISVPPSGDAPETIQTWRKRCSDSLLNSLVWCSKESKRIPLSRKEEDNVSYPCWKYNFTLTVSRDTISCPVRYLTFENGMRSNKNNLMFIFTILYIIYLKLFF